MSSPLYTPTQATPKGHRHDANPSFEAIKQNFSRQVNDADDILTLDAVTGRLKEWAYPLNALGERCSPIEIRDAIYKTRIVTVPDCWCPLSIAHRLLDGSIPPCPTNYHLCVAKEKKHYGKWLFTCSNWKPWKAGSGCGYFVVVSETVGTFDYKLSLVSSPSPVSSKRPRSSTPDYLRCSPLAIKIKQEPLTPPAKRKGKAAARVTGLGRSSKPAVQKASTTRPKMETTTTLHGGPSTSTFTSFGNDAASTSAGNIFAADSVSLSELSLIYNLMARLRGDGISRADMKKHFHVCICGTTSLASAKDIHGDACIFLRAAEPGCNVVFDKDDKPVIDLTNRSHVVDLTHEN